MRRACSLALLNPGSNSPARIAIMAITTSNSIRVKAVGPGSAAASAARVCAPADANPGDFADADPGDFCHRIA